MSKDAAAKEKKREPEMLEMLFLSNLQAFAERERDWVTRGTINWQRAFNDLSARIDLMVEGAYELPKEGDE